MKRGLRAESGTFYDDAATMDYKFALDSLKSIVEMRKNYLEEKVTSQHFVGVCLYHQVTIL